MSAAQDALSREIRRLNDRAEIEDCIQRYCRGADRLDRELLLSAYHPGATDDRGDIFTGSPAEFVDWLFALVHELDGTAHVVCSTRSDIAGDVAHAESYVLAHTWRHARDGQEGFSTMGTARYIDRLERRGGVWGIVHRECLMDAVFRASLGERPLAELFGRRDREDRAYARPLEPSPDFAGF